MKTLRITFILIFSSILSFQSFSQEAKKESKAKFRMEFIDADGNKKIVDTVFTMEANQDFVQALKDIHNQIGLSKEEMAKMKSEFKDHFKHFYVDVEMNQFDKDSLRKHMLIVREEMENGKEKMQSKLEELRKEVESLEMNEAALQKLEQAVEELHNMEWTEHAKQMKENMRDLQVMREETINVFEEDGKDWVKRVWVDNDGEKRIIIKTDIDTDGDSLVWNVKDAKKLHLNKYQKDGNFVFFGDDDDIEIIEKSGGDQKVILRKMKGESKKGDVIFISDDAQVVKEFKDKDGRVKVIEYSTTGKDDNEDKEVNVWVNSNGRKHLRSPERMVTIVTANDLDIEKASTKGVFNPKGELLEMNSFNLNIDNDKTSFGTNFEKKKKLEIKLFDANLNQIWEENAGKVVGEWSTEFPSELLKEKGNYFVLITHGNKSNLLNLMIK